MSGSHFALLLPILLTLGCDTHEDPPGDTPRKGHGASPVGYEVWGSDQSNSVPGESSRGVNGSFIWIWDSVDVEAQAAGGPDAQAVGCAGMGGAPGPCDVNDFFPSGLVEYDADGSATGNTRPQIGRLHGMLVDPQNKYLTANLFAPGGGFVGIIDGRTKEAIALFRASGTSAGRSNHMSFWDEDGSSILIANLNGKILERIDVTRDADGNITAATFDEGAGLGVAADMNITDRPKVYLGANMAGNPMIGSVAAGSPDIGNTTPNGRCRENGCSAGTDGSEGGRPNNLIICPIPSETTDHTFVTLAGGGMFVVDHSTTPMSIVGEYGNQVINGAGCGGVEGDGSIYMNAGVSASGAGATHSTFTIYDIALEFPDGPSFNAENVPAPEVVIKEEDNTATNGNLTGPAANNTGQLPGVTTRRDSHGMARTTNDKWVHTVDRIQNEVEVLGVANSKHKGWYDLTSADGKGNGVGPCADYSVTDDPGLPINDPAPDLWGVDPNGEFLYVAFRGPIPVSVTHGAQGSCPGVGVVQLQGSGKKGRLVTVLRTTNTIDTAPVDVPGGHPYTGAEHSDVHAAIVRSKVEDQ